MTDWQSWAEQVREKLVPKMYFAAEKAEKLDYIPYTTAHGDWKPIEIDWWTNGFWGGEMWQMYLMSQEGYFRDAAIRAETMMDAALKNFKTLHHDVGFMWLLQSGVRYALEKNQDSFDRTLFAANMLAARYNPNGFIRAWNGSDNQGWAIVDCMMNLSLLYWASRQTNDPRYRLIAMRHADTTMKYFVRADGSCNHIVLFDPETGEYQGNPGGQGYASGSSWSRGQAWALYGFTISYRMTGKTEYLETAKRVAHYLIASVQPNWLAACDFRAPKEPLILDNAGNACAASGLLMLADCVPDGEKEAYREAGCCMLKALVEHCADWSQEQPAILKYCTVAYHDVAGRHITMNYADYFLIEAVNKLLGSRRCFWAPDMEM